MSDFSDRDGFHMAETLPDFLAQQPRSERMLLDLLCRKIDRRIDLKTISEADYGYGSSEIYLDLEKICASGDAGSPSIHVIEVLHVTSFSGPDDPKWKPGTPGIQGHLQRAFACAALLQCKNQWQGGGHGQYYDEYLGRYFDISHDYDMSVQHDTLARLLESCIELGSDYLEALKQFIVWKMTTLCTSRLVSNSLSKISDDDEDKILLYAFYSVAFCIIMAICYVNNDNKSSKVFHMNIDVIIFTINCGNYTKFIPFKEKEDWWLYGISCFDGSYPIWHKLAQTHLLDQIEKFPPSLQDTIRFLGDKLVTTS